MVKLTRLILSLAIGISMMFSIPSGATSNDVIVVASTTSTANSGLFDHLLPIFEAETGIDVRVVAVGTGQALRLARNGDADVLFVHHKPSEMAFVADGLGEARRDVMYNDFILVGPKADPAGVSAASSLGDALHALEAAQSPFLSRGDDSGTHKREQALWAQFGIQPVDSDWYRETGSGMGATLNMAQAMEAYTLSDRATWLAFKNKDGVDVVFEGDPNLFNQYGIIVVSQRAFPHVNLQSARQFADWVTSGAGQDAIANFTVNGTQLFYPNGSGS